MGAYLLEMFSVSLGLTLLIELPLGFLMGLRKGKYLLLMVLVNILTNPAAVFAIWLGVWEPLAEGIVLLTEAGIYSWFSRDSGWHIPHPWRVSLVCNGISWLFGILIR